MSGDLNKNIISSSDEQQGIGGENDFSKLLQEMPKQINSTEKNIESNKNQETDPEKISQNQHPTSSNITNQDNPYFKNEQQPQVNSGDYFTDRKEVPSQNESVEGHYNRNKILGYKRYEPTARTWIAFGSYALGAASVALAVIFQIPLIHIATALLFFVGSVSLIAEVSLFNKKNAKSTTIEDTSLTNKNALSPEKTNQKENTLSHSQSGNNITTIPLNLSHINRSTLEL